MKRCPFCAAEIQNEAIKCKYCKEWLVEQRPNKIGENKKAKADISDAIIEIETRQTEAEETRKKGPFRGRWGLLVMLAIYAMMALGLKRHYTTHHFYALRALIDISGLVFTIILYTWLRKKIHMKQKYESASYISFLSGFITYFVIGCIYGLSLGFLSRTDIDIYSKKFDSMDLELRETLTKMNQEEERLWNDFAQNPKSTSDIVVLSELLKICRDKKELLNKWLVGYNEFVIYTDDNSVIDDYSEIKTMSTNLYSTYQKGIELLIESYEKNDDSKSSEALELIEQADAMNQELTNKIVNLQKRIRK